MISNFLQAFMIQLQAKKKFMNMQIQNWKQLVT